MKALLGKLLAVVLIAASEQAMPANVNAAEPGRSHVVVTATLACDAALGPTPAIEISLNDVIVTGRVYYPQAQVDRAASDRLRVFFDIPAGIYELIVTAKHDQQAKPALCDWSGPLMTLPNVRTEKTITLAPRAYLWDRGDFVAGTIAGTATAAVVNLPRPPECGRRWQPTNDDQPLVAQSGHYSFQVAFDVSRFVPGLLVADNGHVTVLALRAVEHTPLIDHAYVRRDITTADLARWASLPSSTIICDTESPRYGTASEAPRTNLQHVDVTALVECSERNDLYAMETPVIEVEDQLDRGRFFYPPMRIIKRIGNVLYMRVDVPAGAYDLGIRFPRPSAKKTFILPCYSTARFAILRGHTRHLTFVICSCGVGGNDRGFVAGRMEPHSIRLAVATLSRNVRCGASLPDMTETIAHRNEVVLDDGLYYGTYYPYDPAKRPVLMVSGPGMSYVFVALDADAARQQPLESLHVFDITISQLSDWYRVSNYGKLICP